MRATSGRFVLASSSSIYGHAESFPTRETDRPMSISPYGVTKLAAEHLCHSYGSAYGIDAVVLRYFTIFGPRQRPDMAFSRFIVAALTGRALTIVGDGRRAATLHTWMTQWQRQLPLAKRGCWQDLQHRWWLPGDHSRGRGNAGALAGLSA